MKALVYMGPRKMELQDVDDPVAGPGDVVIASTVSAVCGSDLHGFREASPRRIPPLVMGHETVGRVDAVGDGIDAARVGERVVLKPILGCGRCGRCRAGDINRCAEGRLVGRDLSGGFAERFTVPASAAVPLPDRMPDEVAVLTEPLANAEHVAARVRPLGAAFLGGAAGVAGYGLLVTRGSTSAEAASGIAVIAGGGAIVTLIGTAIGWAAVGKKTAG